MVFPAWSVAFTLKVLAPSFNVEVYWKTPESSTETMRSFITTWLPISVVPWMVTCLWFEPKKEDPSEGDVMVREGGLLSNVIV